MARLLVAVMLFLVVSAAFASPMAKMVKRQAEREDDATSTTTESPESNDVNPPSKEEETPKSSEASDEKPEASDEKPEESTESAEDDKTTTESTRRHHHHHFHFRPFRPLPPGFFNFGGNNNDDSNTGLIPPVRIPTFHYRPAFTSMNRFFDEVFDMVKNQTSSLPENFNDTKTETAVVDGKNYEVKTTVIKKSDNDTSIFVRVLSVRPADNSTEITEGEAETTTKAAEEATTTSESRVKRSPHHDGSHEEDSNESDDSDESDEDDD